MSFSKSYAENETGKLVSDIFLKTLNKLKASGQ